MHNCIQCDSLVQRIRHVRAGHFSRSPLEKQVADEERLEETSEIRAGEREEERAERMRKEREKEREREEKKDVKSALCMVTIYLRAKRRNRRQLIRHFWTI